MWPERSACEDSAGCSPGWSAEREAGPEGLQPEEPEREPDLARAGAERGGDIVGPGQAQHADREIAQARHGLGGPALADLGAVFVKRPVADVMHLVLDRPVTAVQREQAGGAGCGGGQAGDAVEDLLAARRTIEVADLVLDAEDLLSVGELGVADEVRARPDAALLQASVAFVIRDVLRGEMRPPGGALRCLGAESADCL